MGLTMKLTRKHIRKLIIESLKEDFDSYGDRGNPDLTVGVRDSAWYIQDPYGPHYSAGYQDGQGGRDKWSKAFGIVITLSYVAVMIFTFAVIPGKRSGSLVSADKIAEKEPGI